MRFELRECTLTENQLSFVKKEIGEGPVVSAVFSFADIYVYTRGVNTFDGLVVITGPILTYHVFINRGLTRKYTGPLEIREDKIAMPTVLDRKIRTLVESNDFHELIHELNEIHPSIVEFFKQYEAVNS